MHHRVGVEHVEDPFGTRSRLLTDGEQTGEHPNRGDELDEVGGEREERAEGYVAVQGQPAAQRQHRDLTEGGNGLQGRGEAGLQTHEPAP